MLNTCVTHTNSRNVCLPGQGGICCWLSPWRSRVPYTLSGSLGEDKTSFLKEHTKLVKHAIKYITLLLKTAIRTCHYVKIYLKISAFIKSNGIKYLFLAFKQMSPFYIAYWLDHLKKYFKNWNSVIHFSIGKEGPWTLHHHVVHVCFAGKMFYMFWTFPDHRDDQIIVQRIKSTTRQPCNNIVRDYIVNNTYLPKT